MKSCLKLIAIGFGLGLACTAAQAMSDLASITVTPLWPTNSNPGNTMLYQVQIERQGAGLLNVDINLSSAGLPASCQVSFDTNPVRFTGVQEHYKTVIMSVTSDQPMSADAYAFTVTAAAQRESITYTNQPTATPMFGSSGSMLVQLIPCAGGAMEVHGIADSCKSQQIQSTTDLANPNWTSVGSCAADGNGRFTFVHAQAQSGTCPQRFYRAVNVPPGN
jgi:hypothetical protein